MDPRDKKENTHPIVSIVIPMRDEEEHIGRCLDSLVAQDYPHSRFEVLVADGFSDDQSREIVAGYATAGVDVLLLDNPARVTPHALNTGVRHARGEVIIILGSHSYVEIDFISRNVEVLAATGADCVGGRIETISKTALGRVVSLAMSSPFGVGNARFRTSEKAGFVDTVAFGAYRRAVFDKVGLFDEELVRNQDDEFNFRLTRSGGRIYLDPKIRSYYWSRPTLGSLWRQYYQYGRWKTRILRKHGRLPSTRHIVPAAALTLFGITVIAGIAYHPLAWIPAALLAGYLAASLAVTIDLSLKNGPIYVMLPAAFATLHLSYALGFLRGLPQVVRTP